MSLVERIVNSLLASEQWHSRLRPQQHSQAHAGIVPTQSQSQWPQRAKSASRHRERSAAADATAVPSRDAWTRLLETKLRESQVPDADRTLVATRLCMSLQNAREERPVDRESSSFASGSTVGRSSRAQSAGSQRSSALPQSRSTKDLLKRIEQLLSKHDKNKRRKSADSTAGTKQAWDSQPTAVAAADAKRQAAQERASPTAPASSPEERKTAQVDPASIAALAAQADRKSTRLNSSHT